MSRIIDVAGTKLSIPEGYLPMQPMPDDPPGSLPLGMEGPSAMCFLMVFPIPHEQAMPYDDPDEVIEGIHCSLAQDQGLVEVNTPATAKGKRVIYSVVKTAVQPAGTQYALALNLECPVHDLCIQGFFDEAGATGMRDAAVFSMTGASPDDWRRDPYDRAITDGYLMNRSELPEYDPAFPDHPLSLLRSLVCELVESN